MKFAKKVNTSGIEVLQNWKVLIVDDDTSIHRVTKFALEGFSFEGKGLEFMSAYALEEAKKVLLEHEDIAIMILDVVMDSDRSGFELVEYLRHELKNQEARIILRTGQPGVAPQDEVIVKYDINDYKEKTELTDKNLFLSIITALRSYRDIIKIKEETKRAKEAELLMLQQSKMAAMGELLGVISHQLYQPLTSIHLTAGLVVEEAEESNIDGEKIVDLSEKISEQVRFMNVTIRGFRDFLKPSKRKNRFELISSFVYINDMLRPIISQHGISVKIEFTRCGYDEGIYLYGYESELKHVFLNILTNAKDVIVENSARDKQITTRFIKDSEYVVVEIEDSGGGIDEELLHRVFESGFSTKEERGTGIGLYLAKKIVTNYMSGDISVTNKEQGACFSIKLPLAN